MNHQTLIHSSIVAAIIIAAAIGVSMISPGQGTAPFVSVDPVSDTNAGDPCTITGTTNLPAGTDLMVQVYAESFGKDASETGEFSGALGTVRAVAGSAGTNTWSMKIDTADFVPMRYVVNASAFTESAAAGGPVAVSPFGTAAFTVRPATGKSAEPAGRDRIVVQGIIIDPIRDTPAGTLLTVSGRSSLPAGTDLLVQIVPVAKDSTKIAGDFQHPESSATTKVTAGKGTNNLFSLTIDTAILTPAEHIVAVSTVKSGAAGTDPRPGDITGSALFNILPPATADPVKTVRTRANPGSSTGVIQLDPIADKKTGDTFTLSGTARLPEKTNLLWQILPDTGTPPDGLEKESTMSVGGNYYVLKGDGTTNRISIAVDLGRLVPGNYVAIVGTMKGAPEEMLFEVDRDFGYAYLTLT